MAASYLEKSEVRGGLELPEGSEAWGGSSWELAPCVSWEPSGGREGGWEELPVVSEGRVPERSCLEWTVGSSWEGSDMDSCRGQSPPRQPGEEELTCVRLLPAAPATAAPGK